MTRDRPAAPAPRLALPRRRLLTLAATLPVAAACEPIGRFNDWLGGALQGDHLAPEYTRTTSDFPAYFISPSMPELDDPATWTLAVGGLVKTPMRLTLEQLKALPRTTMTVKHFCVEGWSAISTWSGVRISALAQLVQPLADARYVRFDSFDNGYFNGWDMKSAMHRQTLLAYAWNDRDLAPDHGAPLRLASAIKLGYKLTKYLTSVTFTAERPGGYWEDQGYPWFGGV